MSMSKVGDSYEGEYGNKYEVIAVETTDQPYGGVYRDVVLIQITDEDGDIYYNVKERTRERINTCAVTEQTFWIGIDSHGLRELASAYEAIANHIPDDIKEFKAP